jgi:hypothetical protein
MIHRRPDLPAVHRDLVAILAAALVANYRADQARNHGGDTSISLPLGG